MSIKKIKPLKVTALCDEIRCTEIRLNGVTDNHSGIAIVNISLMALMPVVGAPEGTMAMQYRLSGILPPMHPEAYEKYQQDKSYVWTFIQDNVSGVAPADKLEYDEPSAEQKQ